MSVADILQQMAANAGRAQLQRGAILGNAVTQIANVPGQILDDRERQAVLDAQQARLRAQDMRGAAQDARQAANDARDVAAAGKAAKDQATAHAIITAYTAGTPNDPTTNNLDAGIAKAKELDAAEWIPKLREMHTTELAQANPKPYQTDPTHDTRDPRTNAIITPAVPKAPEMGTPAYEVYARQQALQQPTPAPAQLPGAIATMPPLTAAGTTAPPVTMPPPAPTPGLSASAATQQAYDDQRTAVEAAKAQDVHSPIYKEWKDYTAQGGTLGFDAYMTADANRKKPVVNVGGMNALYGQIDAKAIAAQIRAGQHPPDITQYGRPASAAIASELAKKGPNGEPPMDLASAQRTWNAQKKLNSTMNGPQQVRLDESIRSGLAMYDKVDEIAAQWDGKGWGPLSRTNLAAARDGLKGAKAASIANQLTGQIGQLTSDIATIEQGGLTPTNEARAVAEKSMQDWWGKGTINDMTAQGRANMQIRHLARNTQDVMVPGNGVNTQPAVAATPAPAGAAPTEGQTGSVGGVPAVWKTVNGKAGWYAK